MKAASRIFVPGILVLALCGFSTKFTMEVSQTGEVPSFEVTKRDPLRVDNNVEINTMLVVRLNASGEWDYKHPMWAFKVGIGYAKPLSSVIYGVVPDEFAETTKASPLVRGARYLVVGLSPGSGGSAEFVYR